MRLSKKDCCCGMNMGQGWGDDCSRCPQHGEDEHRRLCASPIHGGSGRPDMSTGSMTHGGGGGDGTTGGDGKKTIGLFKVNECILRPDICGRGQCIDTQEGYKCVCDAGYRIGQSQVCEG